MTTTRTRFQPIFSSPTSRHSLGSGLGRLALSAACAASLLSAAACTRPTVGYCAVDENCDPGQFCSLPAQQCTSATVIRGVFSGGQTVPPTASIAEGSFMMVVSADSQSGTYKLTHTVAQASKMELFIGKVGQVGSLARSIPLATSGTLELDPDTVRALLVGDYYLQISSATFPLGEVRAQLFSDNPDATHDVVTLHGALSGLQSSPSDTSPATGTAEMTLDETNDVVNYKFSYSGLQGTVSGIHVHRGGFNNNGVHIFDLPATTDTTVASSIAFGDIVRQVSDPTLYLAQRHLWRILLKSGMSYLNIHSTAFTKGEIRAQMLTTAARPFNLPLRRADGSMGAQGEGQFYLSADETMLAFRLSHNVSSPTSAVIAKGTAGNRVELTCTALTASGGTDTAQGYCPVDAVAGAGIDITALKNGELTLIIKSAAMPAGEIEGTIKVPPPAT